LDKLFAAHFNFGFDSYREYLCFSAEALMRGSQETKREEEGNRRKRHYGEKKQKKKGEEKTKKNK
jgi:hypothetical protein